MRGTVGNRVARFALGAWLPILLVAGWWVLSANSTNPYFPPLQDIWEQFKALWLFDNVPSTLMPTLQNLFVGYAIGITIGVVAGALVGLSRTATRALMPVIDFLRAIPVIALIPIFVMFLGVGSSMRIVVIAFAASIPVLIATVQGVRSTDAGLVDTGRILKLSGFQMMMKVRLPASSPTLFAALQLSLQVAFLVAIGAEILGSGLGLGAFTKIAQDSFLIVDMWTGVLVMGLVGYALFVGFEVVERFVLRWYYGQKRLEK
jgi:sulfonate transport system permease protein